MSFRCSEMAFRAALTGPVQLILTSTGGQGLVYRYQG